MSEKKKSVYVTGDTDLVMEFGKNCAAAGFTVACRTGLAEKSALPRGFRAVPSVPGDVQLAAELTNLNAGTKRNNLAALDRALPAGVPILSSSVTVRLAEQASWIRRPGRLVGCGAFPTLLSGGIMELSASVSTETSGIEAVSRFLSETGKEISVVDDRPGLVMPRILCMIINEAFFALTENVASPADIDTAMKLGANYPMGPVQWADSIGIPQIVAVLNALREDTGEERYRVAPLLQQMYFSPKWWKK